MTEQLMNCRRDGHDYGSGPGVLPELAEGQTQICVVCGSSRSRSGGRITYHAPPELGRYPLAEVKPRQLAMARLMELTPELRAHYACPAEVDCGHPDCQP